MELLSLLLQITFNARPASGKGRVCLVLGSRGWTLFRWTSDLHQTVAGECSMAVPATARQVRRPQSAIELEETDALRASHRRSLYRWRLPGASWQMGGPLAREDGAFIDGRVGGSRPGYCRPGPSFGGASRECDQRNSD